MAFHLHVVAWGCHFLSMTCLVTALVAAGLGLAGLGLLVRLGLGLARLLAAASAVLSCFYLKSSAATGWKIGVGLEVAGTQITAQGGPSFLLWLVGLFCQFGKLDDVLHFGVSLSNLGQVGHPSVGFLCHRV